MCKALGKESNETKDEALPRQEPTLIQEKGLPTDICTQFLIFFLSTSCVLQCELAFIKITKGKLPQLRCEESRYRQYSFSRSLSCLFLLPQLRLSPEWWKRCVFYWWMKHTWSSLTEGSQSKRVFLIQCGLQYWIVSRGLLQFLLFCWIFLAKIEWENQKRARRLSGMQMIDFAARSC